MRLSHLTKTLHLQYWISRLPDGDLLLPLLPDPLDEDLVDGLEHGLLVLAPPALAEPERPVRDHRPLLVVVNVVVIHFCGLANARQEDRH